jgi:hypothetical protein
VAFNHDFAGFRDFRFQHRVLSHPPHQHAGAPVDEAFRQSLVQRIGKPVLNRPGDALPVVGIAKPIRSIGRERPGSDMRNPGRKGIDVAVDMVCRRDLVSKPVVRNPTLSEQKTIEGDHQFGMGGGRYFPIVGNLAHVP